MNVPVSHYRHRRLEWFIRLYLIMGNRFKDHKMKTYLALFCRRSQLRKCSGNGGSSRGRVEVRRGVVRTMTVVDEHLLDAWSKLFPQ